MEQHLLLIEWHTGKINPLLTTHVCCSVPVKATQEDSPVAGERLSESLAPLRFCWIRARRLLPWRLRIGRAILSITVYLAHVRTSDVAPGYDQWAGQFPDPAHWGHHRCIMTGLFFLPTEPEYRSAFIRNLSKQGFYSIPTAKERQNIKINSHLEIFGFNVLGNYYLHYSLHILKKDVHRVKSSTNFIYIYRIMYFIHTGWLTDSEILIIWNK